MKTNEDRLEDLRVNTSEVLRAFADENFSNSELLESKVTVEDPKALVQDGGHRWSAFISDEFSRETVTLTDGWFRTATVAIVEAVMEGDESTLTAFADELVVGHATAGRLGCESLGRVKALREIARQGLESLAPRQVWLDIERDAHATAFLGFVWKHDGCSNTDIAEALDLDESEVSRTGRTLIVRGALVKRKIGRTNSWSLSNGGRSAVESMGSI